jgi:hypothetical protein
MQWKDWLLGRDSDDLQIVRRIRVVLWWGAWAAVIGSVLALLHSATQPPFIGQTPWFVLALQIIPQAAVPFMGWALVTVLLGIHRLLAVDTDDEEDGDLEEEDSTENTDEGAPQP